MLAHGTGFHDSHPIDGKWVNARKEQKLKCLLAGLFECNGQGKGRGGDAAVRPKTRGERTVVGLACELEGGGLRPLFKPS